MDVLKEVNEAEERIKQYIRKTPLEFSPYLSRITDSRVFLKLENIQITNSFKVRGAFNKLIYLKNQGIHSNIITASTGNHGHAVAYALDKLGLEGTIYLPFTTKTNKVESLEEYNVNIEFYGYDCLQTELYAQKKAKEEKAHYVSPYNDIHIIAGQGTIAREIESQETNIDCIFVPVGGGGLISGIAGYLKESKRTKKTSIFGCQPANSPVMSKSVEAGKIIDYDVNPTISDASAGGIEKGSITFDFCFKYVDDFIIVSEEEIKEAIEIIYDKHSMIAEGAGALSVASFLKEQEKFANKTVVLIISGGKLPREVLAEIICKKEKEKIFVNPLDSLRQP